MRFEFVRSSLMRFETKNQKCEKWAVVDYNPMGQDVDDVLKLSVNTKLSTFLKEYINNY